MFKDFLYCMIRTHLLRLVHSHAHASSAGSTTSVAVDGLKYTQLASFLLLFITQYLSLCLVIFALVYCKLLSDCKHYRIVLNRICCQRYGEMKRMVSIAETDIISFLSM